MKNIMCVLVRRDNGTSCFPGWPEMYPKHKSGMGHKE